MEVCDNNSTMLTVTEMGHGKRTEVEKYRLQRRAGLGTINIRITDKKGLVVGILQAAEDDEVMIITQEGKVIRMPVAGISKIGRATQGVKVIDIAGGDRVVSIARLVGEKD
jgi:DNA gyrase subunit A